MIHPTQGRPNAGMSLTLCSPPDKNGAGRSLTAPSVPGPGVCIPTVFTVHLPNTAAIPALLRTKRFADQKSFSTYLQIWVNHGYRVSWSGADTAVIGARSCR